MPLDITIGLLKKAMEEKKEAKAFLIDGFPRCAAHSASSAALRGEVVPFPGREQWEGLEQWPTEQA